MTAARGAARRERASSGTNVDLHHPQQDAGHLPHAQACSPAKRRHPQRLDEPGRRHGQVRGERRDGAPQPARAGEHAARSEEPSPSARTVDRSPRSRCAAPPEPPPGSLRPFARALLALAIEVHTERRGALGTASGTLGETLRMGEPADVSPGASVVVSGGASPATPDLPGSRVASSHHRRRSPPPVVDPDSLGLLQ